MLKQNNKTACNNRQDQLSNHIIYDKILKFFGSCTVTLIVRKIIYFTKEINTTSRNIEKNNVVTPILDQHITQIISNKLDYLMIPYDQ